MNNRGAGGGRGQGDDEEPTPTPPPAPPPETAPSTVGGGGDGVQLVMPEDGYEWKKYGQKFIKNIQKHRFTVYPHRNDLCSSIGHMV